MTSSAFVHKSRSEKVSTIKGNNVLAVGANSCLLDVLFTERKHM